MSQCAHATWFPTLGSALSPVDGVSYVPSPSMAAASSTVWGRQLSNRTSEALRHGGPIEIAVLGGSVSCGAHVVNMPFGKRGGRPHPDSTLLGTGRKVGEMAPEHAWPAHVQAALAGCLGVAPDAIRLRNLCERAVGSDAWVDKLAAGTLDLRTAHIILVEAASNDAEGYFSEGRGESSAAGFTEVLVHQLLALPQRPFLLWLTAAWRDFEYGTARSAEEQHVRTLRHYAVPHLSVLQALAPVEADETVRDFARHVYFQDCCHPTRLGHKIIAALVVRRLASQLLDLPRHAWFTREDGTPIKAGRGHAPSPNRTHGADAARAYLTARARHLVPIIKRAADVRAPPVHINFYSNASATSPPPPLLHASIAPALSLGFADGAIGRGKRALTSGHTASRLVVRLPPAARYVLVGMLHSYHSTGEATLLVLEHTPQRIGPLEHTPRDAASGIDALEHERLCEQAEADALPAAVVAVAGGATPREQLAGAAERNATGQSAAPAPHKGVDGERCVARAGTPLAGNGNASVLACTRVDLLWHAHISVRRSVHLPLPHTPAHTCKWLVVANCCRRRAMVAVHDVTVL